MDTDHMETVAVCVGVSTYFQEIGSAFCSLCGYRVSML